MEYIATYELGHVEDAQDAVCSLQDIAEAYKSAAYNTTYDTLDEDAGELAEFLELVKEAYATEITGDAEEAETEQVIPAYIVEDVFQQMIEDDEMKSPSFYSIFWGTICEEW